MHTFHEPTLPITEAIKPSTTTSSYVDPNYDYPIKGKSKRLFLFGFLNLKLNNTTSCFFLLSFTFYFQKLKLIQLKIVMEIAAIITRLIDRVCQEM